MTSLPEPDRATLARFNVQNPVFITKTSLAIIWKVQCADGTTAALKSYHDHGMDDEGPGFSLLKALNGQGAAKLYALDRGTALLEWVDGPALGDLSRADKDIEANARLVKTACQLHAKPAKASRDMPHLSDWFAALRKTAPPATLTDQTRRNLRRSKDLIARLLATQTDIRPLHGDLHHDNIRQSPRGDLAFDAKGIIGDRAYELATGFLNPMDAVAIVNDPNRIKHLMQSWGQAFEVAPQTLLDWACAHAALCACWRIRAGAAPDAGTLNLLWDIRNGSE